MPFQIIIKPIQKWIGPETEEPIYSRFKQNYSDTKKILEFELEKLNAIPSSVLLEMFVTPKDLHLNGAALRAAHKPFKPGVVLSFSIFTRRLRNNQTGAIRNETKTLSYPCDTYTDWQDNLRAIALSLQKLRDVARYGVFKYEDMIERLALPSATGKISDRGSALIFLADFIGKSGAEIEQSEVLIKSAYRAAALALHPDKNGGKTIDDFIKFQDAKRILGL